MGAGAPGQGRRAARWVPRERGLAWHLSASVSLTGKWDQPWGGNGWPRELQVRMKQPEACGRGSLVSLVISADPGLLSPHEAVPLRCRDPEGQGPWPSPRPIWSRMEPPKLKEPQSHQRGEPGHQLYCLPSGSCPLPPCLIVLGPALQATPSSLGLQEKGPGVSPQVLFPRGRTGKLGQCLLSSA